MSLKGKKLEEWLDGKKGHVFRRKKAQLKRIGQRRHLAFDQWFYKRYLDEEWWGCDIDWIVFDVALDDIDAIVYDNRNYIPLEVYEFTNYSKYATHIEKGKNPLIHVGKVNVDRHIQNLIRFNCLRYVVFSFPENLTEYALWEYAKNGIRIKVLGYQD